MPKFAFSESFSVDLIISTKLSALAADTPGLAAGFLTDADVGKAVKLGATDRYVLAAVNDEIEGFLVAVEPATIDGYSFGSVVLSGRKEVVLDGAVPIGSLVIVGTPTAKGVALTAPVMAKVGGAIAATASHPFGWNPSIHVWRLISGTGVTGTRGVIERVGEA